MIKRYAEINIQNIYDGIAIRWFFDKGYLRNDFMIDAFKDPGLIQLKIEGSEELNIGTEGELIIKTSIGDVQFKKLYAYQEIDGKTVEVPCKFKISEGNIISFDIGSYNRTEPLVIDPIVCSTYLGGGGDWDNDNGAFIKIGNDGNVYVTGSTDSETFPTTLGAYDRTFNGDLDVFIAKFNPTLSTLLACTYYGGDGEDYPTDMAIDRNNQVYITGFTNSSVQTFPLWNPCDFTQENGEAFAVKIGANGGLSYSTFIGGSGTDIGLGIDIDHDDEIGAGEAYITGITTGDFPTTDGAFDRTYNGGDYDGFVIKLGVGALVQFSTYIGGSGNDVPKYIQVENSGNYMVICGNTESHNFSVTQGAYKTAMNINDSEDGFVTKINSAGSGLLYSTYLGGGGLDECNGLVFDSNDDIFVAGSTGSNDFPVSQNAFQSTAGGNTDAFLSKLSPSGNGSNDMLYSSYIGGDGVDRAESIALDNNGGIYLAGFTSSDDFPVYNEDYSSLHGSYDVFVSGFSSGFSLLYSSYFGGSQEEGDIIMGSTVSSSKTGLDIIVDNTSHDIIVTGSTASDDYPTRSATSTTVYDDTFNGWIDIFVTRIKPGVVTFNLKAILHGAYLWWSDPPAMTGNYYPNYLPTSEYCNGWVTGYPPINAIDWVCIEFRTLDVNQEPSVVENTYGAFIMPNCDIVLPNSSSGQTPKPFALKGSDMPSGDFYIAIKHHNHNDIVSANPVNNSSGIVTYDFRFNMNSAWSFGQDPMIALDNGQGNFRYALPAGDVYPQNQSPPCGNCQIDYYDPVEIFNNLSITGRHCCDVDLNATVNWTDIWVAEDSKRITLPYPWYCQLP